MNHLKKINIAETMEEDCENEENDETGTMENNDITEPRPKRQMQRPSHLRDFVNTVESTFVFKKN